MEEIENNIPSGNVYKYFNYSGTYNTLDENPFKDYSIVIPGTLHGIIIISDSFGDTEYMYELPNCNRNIYKCTYASITISNNIITLKEASGYKTAKLTLDFYAWYK